MMAHTPEIKALVRKYYVFDRLTLEQAAQKASVSLNTARRWRQDADKSGDNWEKARDVQVMVGGDIEALATGLLSGFVIKFKSVMEELEEADLPVMDKVAKITELADSFSKMTASSKRLVPSVSETAVALKVVKLFAEKVKKHKPALLAEFIEITRLLEADFEREFK